ncbi:MAG: hypothetical protein L6Q51_09260 [Cyclobacteriaceae bacterium]|nr:hypothetical protein [Cyclobacteriaceae bacterium]
MSKNKNPLKDLDLFLKQQAASFVNPTPLSERVVSTSSEPGPETNDDLITRLSGLAQHDREKFLDLIIRAAEKDPSPGSTMLINTALYLKSGANWKEAVRQYWQNK